ncbi:MAG: hypothetical protein DRI26_03675 [Chloroflexi bacterium]|nr:MAG: hypothetical protein DRI26_03675 [Chloroflexota bacterium]
MKPGLHERAEGIAHKPVYRISWPKKPKSLFGIWRVPGTEKGSGNYTKRLLRQVNIPPEANKQYRLTKKDAGVQEVAVFLSTQCTETHTEAILAARAGDDWFELYRWHVSWREVGSPRAAVCGD